MQSPIRLGKLLRNDQVGIFGGEKISKNSVPYAGRPMDRRNVSHVVDLRRNLAWLTRVVKVVMVGGIRFRLRIERRRLKAPAAVMQASSEIRYQWGSAKKLRVRVFSLSRLTQRYREDPGNSLVANQEDAIGELGLRPPNFGYIDKSEAGSHEKKTSIHDS